MKRIAASLLRIAVGVPIIAVTIAGAVLLLLSATLRGRSVGLSFLLLGIALLCSIGYQRREWFRKIRRRFYAMLVPLALLAYLAPMMLAPDGAPSVGQVENRYLRGQRRFARFTPANVIPERDQVKIGTSLLSLGAVPYDESARMRSLLMPIYDQIDRDAGFRRLGSAMGAVYRDLARLDVRPGHYYLYMPKTTDNERIPCLIFLHGMGGNIKPCLWLLAKISKKGTGSDHEASLCDGRKINESAPVSVFADEMKYAVVAPTFGIGNWDRPGGAELVVDVAREAIESLPIDPNRIYLMGYSNGALGVTRAAILAPELFAGLIYLSPVTEDELFSDKKFLLRAKDREILFLHGRNDRRIPLDFVEGAAARLKSLGCDARLKIFDDDHYLIFSQPQAVNEELAELISRK